MKQANQFLLRQAEMVIDRQDELEGTKGQQCIDLAKKIIAGTFTDKEERKFASHRDFITLSFL